MRISKQEINRIAQFGQNLCKDESEGPERIAGLFYRGFVSTIASPAGTGKTWLMQILACTLSTGIRLLPKEIAPDFKEEPRKVLILEGEAGTELLNQRLAETNWVWDDEFLRIYNALDLALENIPYLINTPEGRQTIITIMEAERPDIVFFDSFVAWHTADESQEKYMITLFNFTAKLAKHYKCAVVLNHHTRKMPSNHMKRELETDDIVGTGLFARFSRDTFILSTGPDETVRVRNTKSWDRKLPTFSYAFVNDGCYTELAFKIDEPKEDEKSKTALARLYDFINMLPKDDAIFSVHSAANYIRASTRTTQRAIQQLLQSGEIIETKLFGIHEILYQRQ